MNFGIILFPVNQLVRSGIRLVTALFLVLYILMSTCEETDNFLRGIFTLSQSLIFEKYRCTVVHAAVLPFFGEQ